MSSDAILISGLGVISAAGNSCSETIESFHSGKRCSSTITRFETAIKKPVFQVSEIPQHRNDSRMRTLSLALSAVDEALKEAHLSAGDDSLSVGVCMGTTVACQLNDIDFYKAYRETGTGPMEAVDRYLQSNLAEAIAKEFSFTGPTLTVVNACSSGTDAIGIGMSWLKANECDVVITGGADELNLVPITGFNSLGILSETPCSPFDKNRTGLNLGEAGGALVLERAETAEKRGIKPNLTCRGYGTFADAYHLTAPRPDGSGLESAITKALQQAGAVPQDVSFINAHGTATENNDLVEGSTLARIFGGDVKFYSTKGFTGHTLGAAGAIEAVFTCLALRSGWIPESIGFRESDENIPVNPVNCRTDIKPTLALSTSLAFGGNNSAIAISTL